MITKTGHSTIKWIILLISFVIIIGGIFFIFNIINPKNVNVEDKKVDLGLPNSFTIKLHQDGSHGNSNIYWDFNLSFEMEKVVYGYGKFEMNTIQSQSYICECFFNTEKSEWNCNGSETFLNATQKYIESYIPYSKTQLINEINSGILSCSGRYAICYEIIK